MRNGKKHSNVQESKDVEGSHLPLGRNKEPDLERGSFVCSKHESAESGNARLAASKQPDIELYEIPAAASGKPTWDSAGEGQSSAHSATTIDSRAQHSSTEVSNDELEADQQDAQPTPESTAVNDSKERFAFDEKTKEAFKNPYSFQIDDHSQYHNCVARLRAHLPRPLAEFVGTAVAVFLGLCINLAVIVSADQPNKYGTWETQCWGWGFAFMCGIYMSAGISGAHLNPVITIVFAIFRDFKWKRVIWYVTAQVLGGFVGAWLAYAIYQDALNFVDPTHENALTGIAFYPGMKDSFPLGRATAFFNEFLASMVLIMVILALGDDQNAPPGPGLAPFIIATVIAMLMMAFGYNTGPAISPARDLGPRIVALCRHYNTNPFETGFWWWGAWCGTLSGGIAGALVYDVFIFVGCESPVNKTFAGHRADFQEKMHWAKTKLLITTEKNDERADRLMKAAAEASRKEMREIMRSQRGVRTIYGTYTTR